jgi:FkbM family methyltransferase
MNGTFILSKHKKSPIDNNDSNQIISLTENIYILPKNLLDYYVSRGLFEKELIEWCKQLCSKDKTMLDIGAHTGTYSISLAEHCKSVYAFEPQRMIYYSLCGGVALSSIKNVYCKNVGLGSHEQVGTCTINGISLDGGGATIHTPHNSMVLYKEDIEIITLDSLHLENIGFIKMDVENNELQVLQGGVQTLKRSNYPKILFEMNEQNDNLNSFLNDLNYKILRVSYNNMFLAEYNQ